MGSWAQNERFTWFSFRCASFRGELWAVGGLDDLGEARTSCERLDTASNKWVAGPAMAIGRSVFGLAVFRDQLWAVGGTGIDSCECH